ncbi:FAD-dependent oxidoreductase [Erwinia amylovora]|uniref:FAD-dependent oxidoreductase n=2 Tax=Erwinia amylovora TaxID=552 RepID=UPI001443A745|nr:FAD-dependent oxidoreductase [Erwinia amylovora]MBZ2400243.1 FAD-dependent oxidoreductase [Erwinia amylovora]MBZ2403261.1 FAD-dependent oxidoreductase [Erwinia amylovora]UDJ85773.1 FAD-dependent oxidoreductase [Erwinia amylovora]UDK00414.1 FAD-dependent oxidoreductase [Erwinia amylovora]UDK90699.1 FAD-dependent oxidoreductase [Erwinia amylovora]
MQPHQKFFKGEFLPAGQSFVTPVSNPVKRVIVIGAGYSGIAAANALRISAVDVVVLERRPDIGGRTKTVSLAGANAEAGGGWIHAPNGNPLSELADFLSLKRRAFPLGEIFSHLQLVSYMGRKLDKAERDRVMALADVTEEALIDSAASYAPSQTIANLIDMRVREISDKDLRGWIHFVLTTGFEADLACFTRDISVTNYAGSALYAGDDDRIIDGYSAMLDLLARGAKFTVIQWSVRLCKPRQRLRCAVLMVISNKVLTLFSALHWGF